MQPALLADTTNVSLPVSPALIIAGMVLLALPAIVGLINGILSIIGFFRKEPPDHDRYASKESVTRVEQRMGKRMDELADQLHEDAEKADTLRQGNNKELQSIHSQLGRLTGLIETLLANRKH